MARIYTMFSACVAFGCVCVCVFAVLFLLSVHLQQSYPSICRLHSPQYHLSSLCCIPPIFPFYLTLHSQPNPPSTQHPTLSMSPSQSAILHNFVTRFCHWTERTYRYFSGRKRAVVSNERLSLNFAIIAVRWLTDFQEAQTAFLINSPY